MKNNKHSDSSLQVPSEENVDNCDDHTSPDSKENSPQLQWAQTNPVLSADPFISYCTGNLQQVVPKIFEYKSIQFCVQA